MAEPEEHQEETTRVHEATPEPPHDAPREESKEIHEDLDKLHEKLPAGEEKEKPPEGEKQRRPSGKRASIDDRVKSVPVNQDTFIPPGTPERRMSTSPAAKRSSLPGTLGKSPSIARKSRFGALSSKARMVLGSIVDIKTNAAEYYDKKAAKFQNTYKLDSDNPFNPEKVDKILREVMLEVMENLQYDPDKCASTAKVASTQIRGRVKQLEFDRYKLVCIVTIGEKNSQDVYATCRFLWDPEKDRYSYFSMENTHVYGIAYCFGLYYE